MSARTEERLRSGEADPEGSLALGRACSGLDQSGGLTCLLVCGRRLVGGSEVSPRGRLLLSAVGHRPPTWSQRMGFLDKLRDRQVTSAPFRQTMPSTVVPLGQPHFAVIDVETTGLVPAEHRIVEIAVEPTDPWAGCLMSGGPGSTRRSSRRHSDSPHQPGRCCERADVPGGDRAALRGSAHLWPSGSRRTAQWTPERGRRATGTLSGITRHEPWKSARYRRVLAASSCAPKTSESIHGSSLKIWKLRAYRSVP